ncbi:hypothetical protein O6R08_07765 [Cutibacterium equinum]|uniref:Tat pathway signal sequence domain protein n=1 Tax=Cutibacterium equinum TaxID=3016342 RepID=A0ABY7QXL3_9ACTN|nr:hypothetical protein [Cutibacterium equinum]WCC79415.1 hypothetical protein O6R08_07765 [Cutibacterium equinum]
MKRVFSIPVLVLVGSAALSMSPLVSYAAPVENGSQTEMRADVKTGEVKAADGKSDANTAYFIDVNTGDEVSSTQIVGTDRAYRRGNCGSSDACWMSGYPIGDFAFFNKGTTTGYFPQRQSFYSGKYYAKICWLNGSKTVCSKSYVPPNSTVYITGNKGAPVTGKSVTLK